MLAWEWPHYNISSEVDPIEPAITVTVEFNKVHV